MVDDGVEGEDGESEGVKKWAVERVVDGEVEDC